MASGLPPAIYEAALGYPDKLALRDGTTSLTYSDLIDEVRRIAEVLAELYDEPIRVGVIMKKSADSAVLILAILEAGFSYVPMDPSWPASRICFIAVQSKLQLILCDPDSDFDPDSELEPKRTELAVLSNRVNVIHLTQEPVITENEAYILYTSGSTGVPKGVIWSVEAFHQFVGWGSSTFSYTQADRFSSIAPFYFDLSIFDLYVSLSVGASLHIPPLNFANNPRSMASWIKSEQISTCYTTPSFLISLMQYVDEHELRSIAPEKLLFAGEPFPVKALHKLKLIWPDTDMFNLYGPTETNVCTYFKLPVQPDEQRSSPYPIGRELPHLHVRLSNDDPQEIMVRGSIMSGYVNNDGTLDTGLVEIEGERWYLTGDTGFFDVQGQLVYGGRKDRMIKRHGYRIEPAEIEAALMSHPQISRCAVMPFSTETGVRIIAHLEVSGAPKPGLIELKQFCAKNLPTYMIPDQFKFHVSLPLNDNHKIDYQILSHGF